MIERYTRKKMAGIWTDENRLKAWLRVEIAASRALEERGEIPAGTTEKIEKKASINIKRMLEIEETTHHDVIAFTQMITEQLGEEGRWLHYGLTSSDVVDTALCTLIRDALEILIDDFSILAATVKKQAYRYKEQIMVGRTHGVHAEPMTFGMKLALWYAEIERDIERLSRAKEIISVGKLSGAVGTFAHLDPEIEARACVLLGLEPAPISSQIIQRDRHAEVMSAVAIAAGTIEKIAMEIRHLQRTEVREVEEPFAKGQKGSSAMPHKRNPVKSENVSGLARLIRSYSAAALDNIPLWHERDISHSSVERVIFPDAFILLDFITARMDKIIDGLLVYPEAMEKNLRLMRGLVFSGKVLLELVQAGMTRETAYKAVQENAMKVWESEDTLKDLLLKDSRITEILDKNTIEKIFAGEDLMKNVDTVFKRVFDKKIF